MNERFHSIARKVMVSGSAILLSVAQFLVPVYAFGNNWTSSDCYKSLGYMQGSNPSYISSNSSRYYAIGATYGQNSNTYPEVGTVGIIAYTTTQFKNRNTKTFTSDGLNIVAYSFEPGWTLVGSYSGNNLAWTTYKQLNMSSTYTGTNQNGTGTTVYYASQNFYSLVYFSTNDGKNHYSDFSYYFPNIPVVYGVSNVNDILAAISLDINSREFPWVYTSSSGGIHFADGNELDDSNTVVYSNVYTVMDINQDNSISSEEVNYYNVTYDTNYDYSTINNGDDFDMYDFLYYVSIKLAANENPAGDGSGQGSQNTPNSGGIYVGDGSFTQSQSQTIEQNAVNVTVTNNNELTQENLNEINNIINNDTSDQTTFQDAVGNMNQFRGMAVAFAALAGVVLGWLPSWVVGLLGMMFSILSIMIVIRLIHLFV